MLKLLNTFRILPILALLTQCNNKQKIYDNMLITRQFDRGWGKSSFKGNSLEKYNSGQIWFCNSPLFYTAELTLRKDGTFKFYDQGCTGQSFTEGKWVQNEKVLLLTSFDSYKSPKKLLPKETAVAINFNDIKKKGKDNTHYEFSSFGDNGRLLIPGCIDTNKIYFEKVRLQMMGNELFGLGSLNPLGGLKFTQPNKS